MRKILCAAPILILAVFCSPSSGAESFGIPKTYKVELNTREKAAVMEKIAADITNSGYTLVKETAIKLVFDAPLREVVGGFNLNFGFSLGWGRDLDDWREWVERVPPVMRLDFTVVRKTITSVEVKVCPIILWNPGIAYQKDIYDERATTKKVLEEYLKELQGEEWGRPLHPTLHPRNNPPEVLVMPPR